MEDRLTFDYVLNEINTFNDTEDSEYKLSIVRCGALLTLKIQNIKSKAEDTICHGTLKECYCCIVGITRFIRMEKQER